MAIYNCRDPRDYMAIVKAVQKAKDCGYRIELKKFHPVATDKQQRYLNFILSYLAMKTGNTFYNILLDVQGNVCPHVFSTGEVDKEKGYPKYKTLSSLTTAEISSVIRNVIEYASGFGIMIPEIEDRQALQFCERELESRGSGWI